MLEWIYSFKKEKLRSHTLYEHRNRERQHSSAEHCRPATPNIIMNQTCNEFNNK